jgi:hypothetical protein
VQGRGSWLEKIVLLLAQAAFPWDEAPHYLMRDRDRIDPHRATESSGSEGLPLSRTLRSFGFAWNEVF